MWYSEIYVITRLNNGQIYVTIIVIMCNVCAQRLCIFFGPDWTEGIKFGPDRTKIFSIETAATFHNS